MPNVQRKPANEHIAPAAICEEHEIDLLELLQYLFRKMKYIAAASLLGAVLAAFIAFCFLTPKYTATSKLYVVNNVDDTVAISDLQMSTYMISDYQEVFNNWYVHDSVAQKLDLPYTYSELNDMLKVTNPDNTRVLYISVTSEDPVEAQLMADAYAEAARAFVAERMGMRIPAVFETALLPEKPSSPAKLLSVAVGLLLGFLSASAIFGVRFLLNGGIYAIGSNGEKRRVYPGKYLLEAD